MTAKKPKANMVAYGIAKRAATLHMKHAAKWRVQAQGAQEGSLEEMQAPSYIERAERAEALAREWHAKAKIALDPEGHAIKQIHDESGLDAASIEWAKIEDEIKNAREEEWSESRTSVRTNGSDECRASARTGQTIYKKKAPRCERGAR